MEKLSSYITIQEELFEAMKKAEKNFKKTPKERNKQAYIETRLEVLDQVWKDFREGHRELTIMASKSDKEKYDYFQTDLYDTVEEYYIQFKSTLLESLSVFTSSQPIPTTSKEMQHCENSVIISDVKLPRVQLPTFTGKYEEWPMFHDMFNSLVHQNTKLSPVQKLQYLKSNLSGEPQQLLRNFSTTELNYEDAWKQLVRRYNNKKYNCNAVLRTLFSQKKISSESASAVKNLLDTTSSCLLSLTNMGVETDSWDVLIVYLVLSKLDNESVKQWEQQVSGVNDKLATWSELSNYLESRFRSLEMIDLNSTRSVSNVEHSVAKPKVFHVLNENKSIKCAMCSDSHYVYHCKQFNAITPKERQAFVQNNKLCFNCLAPTHAVFKCRHSASCRKCGRRHHTLLHFDKVTTSCETSDSSKLPLKLPSSSNDAGHVVVNLSRGNCDSVLLATAKVKAYSKNKCKHVIRALIDQGSQASFVTEATVQLLGLVRQPVSGNVSGLGDGHTRVKHMVSFAVESYHDPSISVKINAFVLNSVTSVLPTTDLDPPKWIEISNLPLADNTYTMSGKIDLLLGAEVYSEILLDGIIKHPNLNIIAQNTLFGWILSGQVSRKSRSIHNVINMHIHMANEDEILKQFWELENEPNIIEKEFTKTEKQCEEYYQETTARDEEGRYIVKLPFSTDDPQCKHNNSREIAIKRLKLLEKRLLKHPELRYEYNNIMQEYLNMNHMMLIPEEHEFKGVYLPHHCVVREDKTTTKVRVVFDASSKGDNNISLNDELLVGPKLQQDLRHILMRWRFHRIVLVADIVKMYRMVRVAEEDTDFQRIVWRFDPNDPIQDYKLLRLTFGTACAPYLAVRTIQQLAEDEKSRHPIAAKITKDDFYIDDMMTGCATIAEAKTIYKQMNEMMKCGGFNLQKWNSNDNEFLKHIGNTGGEKNDQTITIKPNNPMKVLGVGWNREEDSFEYIITLPENTKYTKRQIISDVARLFDPLGWIAPIVIKAKVFIQKLWKAHLEWDDYLPESLLKEWITYRNSLVDLKILKIPRWNNYTSDSKIELHTFSDASKTAFAAAVYIRIINKNNLIHTSLLTAKTKVAPLKEVTIPRLELCGAVLAAKLVFEVSQILKISRENIYGWTDSTIVLAWLMGGSSRWSTFVNNRVSTILNILEYTQWGHVTSDTNPADCASRGQSPKDLILNSLWWSGPPWLWQGDILPKTVVEDTCEEEKLKTFTVSTQMENEFIWSKFSSLTKMLRVVSYCRRFLRFRVPKHERKSFPTFITTAELKDSLMACVKQIQGHQFSDEIEQLRTQGHVSKRSNLCTLYPILDENGILRVGGRIAQADTAYDMRNPIIMPANNHLSNLLIVDAHHRTMHGGPQVMLNLLRSKYWIVKGKSQVKRIFRDCVICKRYSTQRNHQLMGQIPKVRLKPSKPFKSTGVDYAGPINIRFSPGRGAKAYKGYICLFICMVTRAVHLEAVTDLSAKGFIAAFRRFTARRGHCQDLYSDNGTNFVGAAKLLKEMLNSCQSSLSNEIAQSLTLEGTTWHFIPPHAPNFGGLWEAGVRSTKTHLYKVIGTHTLTYEELSTVLTQVEACLNSRPISILDDNPYDPLPLTPGHFLVGEPLINLADEPIGENHNISNLDRWRLTQKIVRDFWNRWYKTKQAEPNIGDVVVIRDDNIPPAKWILGKIINKFPGPDNITRVVMIQSKNGMYKRPLSKICILCKSDTEMTD